MALKVIDWWVYYNVATFECISLLRAILMMLCYLQYENIPYFSKLCIWSKSWVPTHLRWFMLATHGKITMSSWAHGNGCAENVWWHSLSTYARVQPNKWHARHVSGNKTPTLMAYWLIIILSIPFIQQIPKDDETHCHVHLPTMKSKLRKSIG